MPETLDLAVPANELANHVLEEGRVEEFNQVFRKKIANLPSKRLKHSLLAQHVTPDFQQILESFFEQTGPLTNKKYRFIENDTSTRHFDVAIMNEVDNNRLNSLLISFLDVTDKVDLERELVTSLEHQRRQLGRELHDGVSQLLTGIRLLTETLINALPESMNHKKQHAENILRYAREATDEVSHLEKDLLAGNEMEERGLIDSLGRIADSTDSLPNIKCSLNTSHEELPSIDHQSNWQLHLYRIAQEAVHNAVQHGEPEQIEISLTYDPPRLVLSIRDDGTGFTAAQEPSHGLRTMRHRADSIGATLEIESTEGRGTTVRCILSHLPNNL